MSSISTTLGKASGATRYKVQKQALLDNLETQIRNNSKIAEGSQHLKLGFTPAQKLEDNRNEETKLKDVQLQRERAMTNLKSLGLGQSDVQAVIAKLRIVPPNANSLSEIALFNRYFSGFAKSIQSIGASSLTPSYLLNLWENYRAVLSFYEEKSDASLFVSPADRVTLQKELTNLGAVIIEYLRNEYKTSPATLARKEKQVNDAVLAENTAVLNNLAMEHIPHFTSSPMFMGGIPSTPSSSKPISVASMASSLRRGLFLPLDAIKDGSKLIRGRAKPEFTLDDIKGYLRDATGSSKIDDAKDILSEINGSDPADREEIANRIMTVAKGIRDKASPARGTSTIPRGPVQELIRDSVVLASITLYLISHASDGMIPAPVFTKLASSNTIKGSSNPEGIQNFVNRELDAGGTGVSRAMRTKVLLGSILAGNNNPLIYRRLKRYLN